MNPREKARERILVLRCQAGDEDAFRQLFQRYQSPLKYYLRRLLDSPESADDALQNAWLKAQLATIQETLERQKYED
jgi:RNA polymerase sigma-70 factor (ECF subfamily)